MIEWWCVISTYGLPRRLEIIYKKVYTGVDKPRASNYQPLWRVQKLQRRLENKYQHVPIETNQSKTCTTYKDGL